MIRSLATHVTLSLLSGLVLTAGAFAQPTGPTDEAKKFEIFVGHWQGSGTAIAPGMGEVPWTAVSEADWVLGGFFVEECTQISVGAPMPLQMKTLYGWDGENARNVSFALGNNGEHSGLTTMHWIEDDVLVSMTTDVLNGEPRMGRTTWEFGENSYDFKVETATGAGPFEVSIEGRFEKVEKAAELAEHQLFVGSFPPSSLRKMRKMVGDFATEGWFDFPGYGKQVIQGTEKIAFELGGHVLASTGVSKVNGMPDWEGRTYTIWNATDKCFDVVMFSSHGEVGASQMWWDGDSLLGTSAMRFMGTPMASRSIIKMSDLGPAVVEGHALIGSGEPKKNFHMEYTPRQQ